MATKKALPALPQFTVSDTFSMEDVLSVVSARAEEHYTNEIRKCRSQVRELENTNKGLIEEINKKCKETLLAEHGKKIDALRTALEHFGVKVAVEVPRFERGHDPTTGEPPTRISATIWLKRKGHSNTTLDVDSEQSEEIAALVKTLNENRIEIQNLNNTAISWKQKQNQIPSLERKYKAKIAETKLSASKEGQELLDLMLDGLDDEIASLPVL